MRNPHEGSSRCQMRRGWRLFHRAGILARSPHGPMCISSLSVRAHSPAKRAPNGESLKRVNFPIERILQFGTSRNWAQSPIWRVYNRKRSPIVLILRSGVWMCSSEGGKTHLNWRFRLMRACERRESGRSDCLVDGPPIGLPTFG